MTISIFIFQICMSIENHQCTFSFQESYELRYTQTGRNFNKHMNMIRTRLRFNNLYTLLFT